MKCCKTGNLLKAVLSAVMGLMLLISCSGDSITYCKLVYEVSSDPRFVMDVRMRFPGKDAPYGTGGSYLKQDCGYVPEGFEASVSAEVRRTSGDYIPDMVNVTVRILVDDVCVAESTTANSAEVRYTVKAKQQ